MKKKFNASDEKKKIIQEIILEFYLQKNSSFFDF
jgi:hypothetical protein